MRQFMATGSVLVLCVLLGQALGQTSQPSDELRFRGDTNQGSTTTTSDTTIIDDSAPTTTPTTPADYHNQNQVQPFQNTDDNNQQGRPNHRRRPRPPPIPFNPFAFLLSPPSFHSDPFDFQQSPLINLLGGGGGGGSGSFGGSSSQGGFGGGFGGNLFNLPDIADLRNHMNEEIGELESKPDLWSKEVRKYTIDGVQYEKITFTRKVDGQQQQQLPAQIDMDSNGEEDSTSQQPSSQQQTSNERPQSPLFSRPSFGRSLSNLI